MLDFFLIGPPKCGTTLLQNILIQNPGIYLSLKKEIQFFSHHYNKGYKWYNKHFSDARANQVIGEISPTYCNSHETLQRIKKYAESYNKDVKIIITIRNPIKRLLSEYYHNIRRANYDLSIEEAIQTELNAKHVSRHFTIVRNSLYNQILNDVYSLFKKENVLILESEKDIYDENNLPGTIRAIEDFLNVEHFDEYIFNVEDNSSYAPKSYLIQRIIFQENPVKKFAKTLMPSFAIRKKIRKFLINKNTKAKGYDNKSVVPPEVSQNIYEKYLKDDYTLFKSRTDYKTIHA